MREPGTAPSPESIEGNTIRRFLTTGAVVALFWSATWFLLRAPVLGYVVLTAGLLLASLRLAYHRVGLRRSAHLGLGAAVAVILALIALTGGVTRPYGVWLFILPTALALLLGARAATFWGAALGAVVIALWVFDARIGFADFSPPGRSELLHPLQHVTAFLTLFILSVIYAADREAAQRSLSRSNQDLKGASSEHERRAERLVVLNDVSRTLASKHSLDELYRTIYHEVGHVLARDVFYVALLDAEKGTIRFPLVYDGGVEHPGGETPLGHGPAGRAVGERRTFAWLVEEVEPTGATIGGDLSRRPRAGIHAPMIKDGRVLGVMSVQSYEGEYTEEDVRLFDALANQAAVALENAQLYETVQASEVKFRELLRALERMEGHNVVVTDLEGTITYAAGMQNTHHFTNEEVLGLPVTVLGRNVVDAADVAASFTSAMQRQESWTRQILATRKSGENFPILISASPLYGPKGELAGVVTIGRDLTDDLENQRRLLQSSKLASIGELVAGVAHELNNPLAVVKSTASLLADELHGPAAEDARTIFEQAERAAKIVRNLLRFARQSALEREAADLNEVVERVATFRTVGLAADGVELERSLAPDLPPMLADASQIEQVVLNLVNNAAQAIASTGRRGTITLRTRKTGGTLVLEVIDSGPGIPEEDLGRVFDPFFTTRQVGEGTGLGLAVSHGIIQEHGGSITAASEPGHGSTFTIKLPAIAQTKPLKPVAPPEPTVTPSKSVLIVDDEPGIRRALRRFLERRGHRVEEAESGMAALERVEATEFDAIVTDLKMPEMAGDELFRVLHERHPELAERVIFATGDVMSLDKRKFLEASGRPVFEKPYDLLSLARRIEEAEEESGS